MFGSRKNRPPNPPLNASAVSPSAATAALTAFRRDSTASTSSSLSAAAAAAALRARPTTPIDVASVQTKRTLRRSASGSSSNFNYNYDGSRRGPSPNLRRQPSSGSMTERTFRSPSPGPHQRSQSSGSTPRRPYSMDEAPPPPVPAIPESVNMAAARAGGARPKSLGFVSAPVKTASQRMAETEKGGSWFGGAKVGDLGSVRTNDTVTRSASVRTAASAQPAPESPTSVNFSYPARVRIASPSPSHTPDIPEEGGEAQLQRQLQQPPAPNSKKRSSTLSPQRGGSVRSARPASIASDRELVYDPNSRRMVPRGGVETFEPSAQPTMETRPKKKKAAGNRAGSHLAKGTMGRSRFKTANNGTPSAAQAAAAASLRSHKTEERESVPEEQEEYYEEEPEAESLPLRKQKNERQVESETQIRQTQISMSPAFNAPEVYSPSQPDQYEGLQRRPSVVREESDESASEAELEAPSNAATALDAVPVRHSVYRHGVPSPPQSENTDDTVPVELAASSARTSEPIPEKPEPREAQKIRRESRDHSNSPVRNAHFGPVQETLTVKHEPPVRSLSPRKSALKRSPSRGASPVGDRSDASGADIQIQEPPPPRKKSVRVSFDDENTIVVGEGAGHRETYSPVPPSPQQATTGAKKWYSTLGIGRKKDAAPLDEDEVMKPRPALPSFGSVRTRKVSPKPSEERALVRPHDALEEVSESPNPELQRRNITTECPGQSSDHMLGAIINAHDSRNGMNISKQREPLPPVVTSLEGNGYESDSTGSDEDDSALLADTPQLPADESTVSQASTLVPHCSGGIAEQRVSESGNSQHEPVPFISLTQPTPPPEKPGKESDSYMRFPGGFPETETETETESEGEKSTAPARQATFEPVVQERDATATAHTPATVLATQPALEEMEHHSDGSSIYSDAYEDLSDVEGDGFMSLDAVVDSPVDTTPPRRVLEKAHAQRPESTTPTPMSRGQSLVSSGSGPVDQWAAAKAYWRSLTADKRAQLEKEAADEAGAEADVENVQQAEAVKPRRKKSVEKRSAEKKAIEQQRTIEQQRAVDPSRTYMISPGTKAGSIHSEDFPSPKAAAPREYQLQPNSKSPEGGICLQKTVRSAPDPQSAEATTHFRKSMRGAVAPQPQTSDGGMHMRKPMRSAPTEQPAPRQRPVSHQPLGTTTEILSTSNKGRHTRSASQNPKSAASAIQPSLRRRGSDSSTSSFKRARGATSVGGFGGFRKTMRGSTNGGSFDPQDSRDTSIRFSLRATSPPTISMRSSLRGERRKSDDSGKGYLRFPGRSGKSEKGKQTRSRFGDDSSDEEEVGGRRTFSSRFDDSSDEDVVPALEPQPSLGAKTMRSGHKGPPSPPLPEEEENSDESVPPVVNPETKSPAVTSSLSGSGIHGARQRRGSFISSVLRRNKKHDGEAKISRPDVMDSAARRDTGLERSMDELTALRSGGGGGPSSPPKLQKRVSSMKQDWPLTPAENADDDKDIFYDAVDGGGEEVLPHSKSQPNMLVTRPGFIMRRQTSNSVAGTVTTAGGTKKKKFGTLRRMLRLDE